MLTHTQKVNQMFIPVWVLVVVSIIVVSVIWSKNIAIKELISTVQFKENIIERDAAVIDEELEIIREAINGGTEDIFDLGREYHRTVYRFEEVLHEWYLEEDCNPDMEILRDALVKHKDALREEYMKRIHSITDACHEIEFRSIR